MLATANWCQDSFQAKMTAKHLDIFPSLLESGKGNLVNGCAGKRVERHETVVGKGYRRQSVAYFMKTFTPFNTARKIILPHPTRFRTFPRPHVERDHRRVIGTCCRCWQLGQHCGYHVQQRRDVVG